MTDLTLKTRLTADGAELIGVTREAEQALGKLANSERETGDAGKAAGKDVDDMGKKFEGSSGAAKRLIGSLVAMAASYISLRTAVDLVKEFRESEIAAIKLDTVINSMSRSTPGLGAELRRLASQIQSEGIIGDDAIVEGQAFLAIYSNISDALLPRATRAMVNLAALMGSDVSSAARAVGMASEGTAMMLQRMGIKIDEDILKSGDFESILSAIEGKLGEGNQALAKGAGHWEQLGIRIGETKEQLGGVIANSSTLQWWGDFFVDVLEHMAESVDDYSRALKGIPKDFSLLALDQAVSKMQAIQGQLAQLESERRNSTLSDLEMSGFDRRLAQKQGDLQAIERQIQSLRAQAAAKAAGAGADGTSGSPVATLTDDQQSQARELQKQLDLYGQVGRAAELRWEMEHQGMEAFKKFTPQMIMQLATELDARDQVKQKIEEQTKAEEDYLDEILKVGDRVAEQQQRERDEREQTLQQRWQQLDNSLQTELELEAAHYAESLRLLAEAERKKLAHTQSWAELRNRIEMEHHENVIEIEKAIADKAKQTGDKMGEFSVQAARNMQSAFGDLFFNTMNGEFDNLVGNFASALQRMAAELAASQLMKLLAGDFDKTGEIGGLLSQGIGFLGSLFGGGSIPGTPSLALPGAENLFAGFAHRGGIAGDLTDQRVVSAAAFRNAKRLHLGGLAGNEVPAVLLNDEEVLTRQDPRHRANGGGRAVVVNLSIDARNADAGVEQRLRKLAREEIIPQAIQGATAHTLGTIDRMRRSSF